MQEHGGASLQGIQANSRRDRELLPPSEQGTSKPETGGTARAKPQLRVPELTLGVTCCSAEKRGQRGEGAKRAQPPRSPARQEATPKHRWRENRVGSSEATWSPSPPNQPVPIPCVPAPTQRAQGAKPTSPPFVNADTHTALPQPLQEHPRDPTPPPHPPSALFHQQPAQIPHPTCPILPSQTNLHTRSTAFHPEQPNLVSFLLMQSPARSVPPPAYWTSLCRLLHSYSSWRPTFSQHFGGIITHSALQGDATERGSSPEAKQPSCLTLPDSLSHALLQITLSLLQYLQPLAMTKQQTGQGATYHTATSPQGAPHCCHCPLPLIRSPDQLPSLS